MLKYKCKSLAFLGALDMTVIYYFSVLLLQGRETSVNAYVNRKFRISKIYQLYSLKYNLTT